MEHGDHVTAMVSPLSLILPGSCLPGPRTFRT